MQSWNRPDVPDLPGHGEQLRLFDTSSATIVDVGVGEAVSIYVCGITPYDATHLGHAATYLAFDLAQRVWLDSGKTVRYIQNVTDIDDPLLDRAAQTGEGWQALAEREIALFRADMTALRVLPPAEYVGAVESIPQIAEVVAQLLERRAAYRVDTDVYYRIDADPAFGSESGLNRRHMLALFAERGGDPEREEKQDPLDSLLWLGAREGEPSWPSVVGPGRPGWHVECTYIALSRIGMGFDVQGGGSDLAFPHHEHSAAHARSLTGEKTYAKAYVHAGMIGLDGEKMSKSRGNLVFVSKLRGAGVDPMAIRLALLDGHYRADREWTGGRLPAAEARLARWRTAVAGPALDATALLAEVRTALADDLDSSRAIAAVDDWVTKSNAANASRAGAGGSDTGGADTGGADTGGAGAGSSDTGGSDTGGADTAVEGAGALVRDLLDALLGIAL